VIGTDGTVTETGSYNELSKNPDSAFSKLMEWQLTGDGMPAKQVATHHGGGPRASFEEEVEYDLEERHEEQDSEDEHDRDGGKKAAGDEVERKADKAGADEKQ
jgi:putative ABC transport system ATP-binding protein